jgi:hypothetical protein
LFFAVLMWLWEPWNMIVQLLNLPLLYELRHKSSVADVARVTSLWNVHVDMEENLTQTEQDHWRIFVFVQ